MHFIKAHAYGNDFVYAGTDAVRGRQLELLARELCDRHTGIGADGDRQRQNLHCRQQHLPLD